MPNFLYDNVTLPGTKTNARTLITPVGQSITGDDFNIVTGALGDIRTAFLDGEFKNRATAVSAAANARLRMYQNRFQLSRNGLAFKSFEQATFNAIDYMTCDGETDDSVGFQALMDAITELGQGAKCARIRFELDNDSNFRGRRIRITKPIRYQGNSSCAMFWSGVLAARGDAGVQIIWDGPAPMEIPIGGVVRTSNTVRVSPGVAHPWVVGDHVINANTEGDPSQPTALWAGLKTVTATGGSGASAWFEYAETGTNVTSEVAHVFGQAMFEFKGINSSIFEHLQFHGRDKALYNVWLRGSSASIFFDHVVSSGPARNRYSACWAVGEPQDSGGTYQTSEVFWHRCEGGGLGAGAVIKMLSAGNTKNFHLKDTILQFGRVGIDHPGEGIITADNVQSLGMTDTSVKLGMSRCVLKGFECEDAAFEDWQPNTAYQIGHSYVRNGGNGYQCTQTGTSAGSGGPSGTGLSITDGGAKWEYIGADGSRFLTGGAASVDSSVTLLGCTWDGRAPTDSTVLSVSCQLSMIGNRFSNSRTGSTIPWIRINGATVVTGNNFGRTSVGGGSVCASVFSTNNFFDNCTGFAPIFDGSNLLQASIAPSAGYALIVPHEIYSFGDVGGGPGSQNKLRRYEGYPPSYATLVVAQNIITGVTVQELGQPGGAWARVTIDRTAWKTNGLTQSLQIFKPAARFKLKSVYASVVTAVTGVTGPLTLKIGITNGGDELLVSTDVGTIKQIGTDTSHLGSLLTGSTNAQGGVVIDWTNESAIYATLTSASGNLGNGTVTNLTTGSIDLILEMDRIPGKYS